VSANPPSPLVFPSPISPGSWVAGDGLAFIQPDGTNPDAPGQWINRRGDHVTPGAANTQQPAPTVSYGAITVPGSFPNVNACDEIEVPINVNYSHEAPVFDANLTFTVPGGFFFASASADGVFDATTRTVSWSLGALNGNKSVSVRVRPSCSTTSGQFIGEGLALSFLRFAGQSPTPTVSGSNATPSFNVSAPALTVTMTEYGTGNSAIVADISTLVEFQIEVKNTGSAPMSGAGAYMTLQLKPDLLFVGFRKNGPTGDPVDYLDIDVPNGIFTGWTGAMDPGDTRTFYVKAMNVGCAEILGSAKIALLWGCGDGVPLETPGRQTCSIGANTSISVLCPPTLTFAAPSGVPPVYMGCQDVTHNIVMHNPNGVPLRVTGLELNLPTDTYWISSKIGATDVGTYDQPTKKLTFTAAELTGGTGEIAANGTITVVLVMRPNCVANTDRRASGVFNYEFGCLNCGWLPGSVSTEGRGVPLRQPALAVTVQDPNNPDKTTVLAERGETVKFKVVVVNNGMGDLNTASEGGGWVELLSIGSGLALQTIKDITAGMPGTEVTPVGNRWETGTMAAGASRSYLVEFLVQDCVEVGYEVGTYWTCVGTHADDHCRQDGESKGSVNIILRNPSLSITTSPFAVDYCNGVSVSIPVTNANEIVDGEFVNGMARDVRVDMMGISAADFDITMAPGSPFTVSHAGNMASFSLVNGSDCDQDGANDDIGRGQTYYINFTVKVKDGVCSPGAGGPLIYQPYYEDSCNIPYTSGTQLSSFTRSDLVGVSFTKSGPPVANVGDTDLTWTITLNYTGEPNSPFIYTLTDNYPDATNNPFGNFVLKSVSEGGTVLSPGTDYTDDGDKITRNVSTTFDGFGNFSQTYTIVFDTPNSVCAGGQTYTNNASVAIDTPAAPIDCNNCPLPKTLTAASSITFNNSDEDYIDQHTRRVRYDNLNANGLDNSAYQTAAEVCTTMVFDQILHFTSASPNSWKVDVDPGPAVDMRPVRFHDPLDANLRAPGGDKQNLNVKIYYFSGTTLPAAPSGTDYGPGGSNLVTWNDVSYTAGNSVGIDLGGLDGIAGLGNSPAVPQDAGILWIRYTLQSQANSIGNFNDFAMVAVPLPGGDPCNRGPEAEYHYMTPASVADSDPTVSISSSAPFSISRCETITLRFNLGMATSHPFDVYDNRLVVDLRGNYRYLDGTTVFGDALQDEGSQAITSFEPAAAGTTLTWNIGDIRGLSGGGNRYVEIQVQKTCDQTSTRLDATLLSNDHCSQIPDGNGPGQANKQDTEIAGITSFINSDSDSYEPLLYSGRLETRFASQRVFYNDAYPTVLLHVVNSGNGTLYNARIPVELGSVLSNTGSLTFLEAHVTAVSGQTSAVIDPTNPIIPVALEDESAHGYRKVTLGVDWMGPSSIVTIRLRLRMVLCADLSLKINQAHWGCPPGPASACPANLAAPELNSYMEIKSGGARVVVIEHQPTPSILDLCGSRVRVAIEVLNAGSVNVYEPIIRERLPEGLQIVPDSVEYSINGGALTPFPEASGAGLRYTSLTTVTTPGIGPYQTILWSFTDPNGDHNEADSLLPSPAFDDPKPDDPLFNRHLVMKPATRLRIEFEAELDGCANVDAYQKSDKRGMATLLFDLPCHHDNRVDAAGNALATPRLPLDDNTREVTLIDPGKADVQVNLKGQNITQNAPESANQINAEFNDEIEWTVTLKSLGPGVVPNPTLELFVPSILSADFANDPPVITSPANIVFVNSNPAGVPQANPAGTKYTFVFRNTDPAMVAADREYYFSATESVTLTIPTKIIQCIFEKPTLEARLLWGCCPGLLDASGQHLASMPIKSRADEPTLSIVEGDDGNNVITEFDSCLGAYTITLTSPITNRNLSLWDLDVTMTLPNGWAYAPLAGDGTDFIYAGTDLRPDAYKLTAAQEEPVISGKTLRWHKAANGGNIPDNLARVFPREELKIIVYLRADGSAANCDLDPGPGKPPVPNFTQTVTARYKDSCGDVLDSPKTSQVSISPKSPNLSVALIPTPSTYFISGTDDTVNWILRLWNNGDKTATNIKLDLDFGAGYSSVTFNSGTPPPTQAGNSFAWAVGTIPDLAPLGHIDWHFTGNIDKTNRDSLTARAIVKGYCNERDGSQGCTYSFQELEEFVSGAAIAKTLDGTRLAAPAASTPTANDAAAVSANVSIGTILRNVIRVDVYEGGLTNLEVRDVLPSGLVFLEANLVDSAGALVANLTPTSTTNNIITFSHSTVSQLANITGGRTGANALFIEIWTRVDDNTTVVTDGELLTNTAQLSVKRGNRTFDHTTPGVTLFSDNAITILEPFIQDDASLTKTSLPVSLPEDHSGAPLNIAARPTGDDPVIYTFSAKNTGTSPAYELVFTDLIPWQLANPSAQVSPYEPSVTITPDSGSARVLTNGVDYNMTWTAGVDPNPGTFKINLLTTANAALGVNETITIAYYGKIATFAPGTFVDNSGKITGYSSLPGDGATLTTARGTSLAENADQRVSYASTYRPLPEKRTYHKFTSELDATGGIIAEVTPMSDGAAPALRSDGTTRATIGEKVEYHLRLDLPDLIRLYDLSFSLDVPDGLTVTSAQWEIVATGGNFSGAEKTLSFTELGTGITQVRGQAGAGANDFPQPINNTSGSGQEMLVKVMLRVDRSYTGGAAVLTGNTFNLPASFAWGDIGSVGIAPVPAFTIVEPNLTTLTKVRNAHLQSDNSTAATSPGTGTYRNFNPIGPDSATSATDPVNNVYQVRAGEIVEYKLTFRNDGNATAWDVTLRDIVPSGMTLRTGSVSITTNPADAGITISTPTPAATLDFTINRVLPGHEVTVLYRCNVDTNVAAGRYLQNQAEIIQYSSLPEAPQVTWPDYDRSIASGDSGHYTALGPVFEKVGTPFPTSSKTVTAEFTPPDAGVRATIGEKITYTLRLNIPDTSTLYDLTLVDVVPDGLQVHSANYSINGAAPVAMDTVVNANGTTTVSAATTPFGDVAGTAGVTDDIVITIIASVGETFKTATGATDNGVSGVVDAGDVFANNATFTWNQLNGEATTALSQDVAASAVTFTIVEPLLAVTTLTKTRTGHYESNGTTPATSPGTSSYSNYNPRGPVTHTSAQNPVPNVYQVTSTDILEYTVTFTNTGTARAYDILLTDAVPAGISLVTNGVNAPTISGGTTAGIAFLNSTPAQPSGSGTPINFKVNWLDPGQTCTITFRTKVESGVGVGAYLQNELSITDYGTTPDATAAFPDLERDTTSTAPYTAPYPKYEKVGTPFPISSKTVEAELTAPAGKRKDGSNRATIGEKITYELRLDIPGTTSFYDFAVVDVLPDGLQAQSASYSINGGAAVAMDMIVNANGTTTVSATTHPFGDVAGVVNVSDEIIITIVANVKQAYHGGAIVDAGDIFANNATFTWNQIKGNTSTALSQNFEPVDVTFTIQEPKLENLTKAKAAVSPASFGAPLSGYRNYETVGPNPNNSGPVNNVDVVSPGHIVSYTLRVTNNGDGIAYEVDLVDIVPVGMSYVAGSATVSTTPVQTPAIAFRTTPTMGADRKITFELNQLAKDATATIEYVLQVDNPAAAGRFLLNQAVLHNYRSLPSTVTYPADARDITTTTRPAPQRYGTLGPAFTYVGTAFPTTSKTVESEFSPPSGKLADGSARGTIGEVMTYELLVDIPDNHILYDMQILDVLPANLTVRSQNLVPADITYAVVNSNGTSTTYNASSTQLTIDGNTVSLYLPSDVQAANGVANEIRLVIAVTVDDVAANVAGVVKANTMTLSWNQIDESPSAPAGRTKVNSIVTPGTGTVNFTIIEPLLATTTLTKVRSGHYQADGSTAATSPGTATYNNYNPRGPNSHLSKLTPVPNVYQVRPTEIVQFTVTFTNTGTARAYDILLTDYVPAYFTLLTAGVNAPTISGGTTVGIAFINSTPAQAGGSGTPITFAVNWLDPGQTCTITFRTKIEAGIGAGAYLQNELTIDDYGTTPNATAVFPELERDTTSAVPYTDPNPKYEKVGTEYPVTSKTIQTELTPPGGKLSDGSSRATIGELVTYEILLDIKDNLQLFDLSFSDLLPDGLTAVSATYAIQGGASGNMTIGAENLGRAQITAPATMLTDVAAVAGHTNEVVFTIKATVDQRFVSASGATDNGSFGDGGANGIVDAGDILSNNATFTWNQINDVASASTQNAAPAPVSLTILEPRIQTADFTKVIKQVLDSDGSSVVTTTRGHAGSVSRGLAPKADGGKASYFKYPVGGGNPTRIQNVQVVLPDDYVEYQITVTNSGNARAFDVKISDILPRVDAVTYVSGTGDFAVGALPYQSGTTNSKLTVASSTVTVNPGGINCTRLDFTIDMLEPNQSAVILYRVRVNQGLGAGNYIGLNVASLEDYGTLPDGTFTVQVGNLLPNTSVHDNSLERDTASDPPSCYAKLGPIGDDIGVQYPEFTAKIYRHYDIEGREVNTEIPATTLRIGELLTYELIATLPRHTTLFDGGASDDALAFRQLLNPGYHLIPGTEVLSNGTGGTIDLTGKLKGGAAPTPYPLIPSIDVPDSRQAPTWYFTDIANTTGSAQTARLRFQVEIRNTDYTGAPYFTDQTKEYSLEGRSFLYWNTIDAPEKKTLDMSNDINVGDHPFLQNMNVRTTVRQPNLQLFKTSVPEPNSIVGVTAGVGDLIKYTLTMRNWNNASAGAYQGQYTAYNAKIIDILPKDFAPVPPAAPPTLTAAVHAIDGNGVTGGVVRSLVLNEDYTYTYDFDTDSRTGTITFTAIRDSGHNSYDSRIEANQALVISYEMRVNPEIGTQGSGAGQRINYAMLQDYYSFPEGLNDPDRKHYGPEGPRRVSLLTDTPVIIKSSDNADESVVPGDIVEYTIVAPAPIIRANLYEVLLYDIIPDGFTLGGNGTITGIGPGPVSLNIGDDPGQVPGPEIVVTGGRGNVKITVTGRRVDINIDKIDAEGGGHDQVTVTLRCLVKATFSNDKPIPRLHQFTNNASLLWYDDDASFPDRVRYAVVSNNVLHFFNASGIIFEPSQTGTAQPGTIRTYRHILRSFEKKPIIVPLTFSSTQENWIWQLFIGDGNGNLVGGPYNSVHPVSVPAEGMVEVIMRVFVPTDITSMITDVLTVTATGGENISTITDVTVTTPERIAVFKDVKTTGDFTTRLQIQPKADNAIIQRIRFFNNGPEDVKEVYVYDYIPTFSSYIANTAVNTADYALQYSKDGGVNWIVGEPAANGETVVDGRVPAVTNLRWYYKGGGVLTPGDEHVITFQIRIK